ncbi:ATP/GTP-binding protein, partial [Rhizobium ruizarguesonis]
DLSAYSIPVPSLLGQRRAPGDAEVASTDPMLTGANGLPVPTPVERPAVAENLLAAAQADPEAEADEADQDAQSPAVADALDQQRNDRESQIASKQPP